MRFYGHEKQDASPESHEDKDYHYPQNYPGAVGYGDEVPATENYDADLHVQCPSHTTERKLITRVDLHVIPFLCILYRTRPLSSSSSSEISIKLPLLLPI